MSTSRRTVALTSDADAVANDLLGRFSYFREKQDVMRIGFAWAILAGLSPARDAAAWKPGGSTYSVGGLDPEGQMIQLVDSLYQDRSEDRAVLMETLLSKGLLLIGEKVREGKIATLEDLVRPTQPEIGE